MIHAGNLAMEVYEFLGDRILSRNFCPLYLQIYDHRFSVFEARERKGLQNRPAYIIIIETNTSSSTEVTLHRAASDRKDRNACVVEIGGHLQVLIKHYVGFMVLMYFFDK
jgi:hypothetical protein